MSGIGAIKDREYSKFVTSPSRGESNTAIEVFVGNTHAQPVPVDPTTRGTPKVIYNEVNSTGLQTITVIDFTIGLSLGVDLTKIECSGDNKAIFLIEVNSSVIKKKRTYYTKFNVDFELKEFPMVAGDNIKVLVENKTNLPASFNATLNYNEYDV